MCFFMWVIVGVVLIVVILIIVFFVGCVFLVVIVFVEVVNKIFCLYVERNVLVGRFNLDFL